MADGSTENTVRYIWSLTDKQWKKYTGKISNSPSLIFSYKGARFFWCAEHSCYERINKADKTEKGCSIGENIVQIRANPHRLSTSTQYFSYIWEALLNKEERFVEVAVYAININTNNKFIWTRFSLEDVPQTGLKRFYQRFYFDNDDIEYYPESKYDIKYWAVESKGINYEEVREIYKEAARLAKDFLLQKDPSGYMPDKAIYTSKNLWYASHDYNDYYITFLNHFIGEDFDRLFPKKNTNNYAALCHYLNITPPKSLKKRYVENPYSIILYFQLIRWGLEDINAINLFLDDNTIINQTRYYSYNYRYNVLHCGPPIEADLRFFVRWLISQGKSEMVIARQFYSFYTDKQKYGTYSTLINDFHLFYPILSQETKEIVKRRGLSDESNEHIQHDILAKDVIEKTLHYKDFVMELNDNIDGVEYTVITNTLTFPKIGRALSNCVATYCHKAIKGTSIIVAGSRDNKYEICIELTPVNNNNPTDTLLGYKQILGRFNQRLEGILLTSARKWAAKHNLVKLCNDIG